MSHKRKRSYESLSEALISNDYPTKVPKVDSEDAIQDSRSLRPPNSLNTSAAGSPVTSSLAFSEASLHHFPLTRENLRKFNRNNKAASTPANESQKTQTSTTSTSEDLLSEIYFLKLHNIHIEDLDAERRGADLIEKARAIVTGERHSALKMEQAQALAKTVRKHEDDNELTFLVGVWSKLLGMEDTGLVTSTIDNQLEDEEEAIRWIEAAWEKDHLKCTWNAKFKRDSIPLLDFGDWIRQCLAERGARVKNPKPALTYGLKRHAFSVDEQYINNKYGAALSLNMEHPFFVVETLSFGELTGRAENRCAVGGATMVRLKRKFDSLAKGTYHADEAQYREDDGRDHERIPVDRYRTDTKSFAFSLIISSRLAEIFVHWAEEVFSKEGQLLTIEWHANHLTHYFLRQEAHCIELHRDINNVLDWGTLTRKQELGELCRKILEREQSNKKEKT